jgi:hypothetical protein
MSEIKDKVFFIKELHKNGGVNIHGPYTGIGHAKNSISQRMGYGGQGYEFRILTFKLTQVEEIIYTKDKESIPVKLPHD